MQSKINEIEIGKRFNSLVLTGEYSFITTKEGKRLVVEAKCDCGNIKNYPYRYLVSGNTKSCGCERRRKIIESRVTHHLSKHPLYSVYQDIKRRCYDEKCEAFKDYGARGIKMCDEWFNDIKLFVNWAEKNGYEKGLEIDRRNNDGDYEPSNCRFVTRAIGNTNTRRTKQIFAFNESKTAAEWARDLRCNVSEKAITERIKSGKWNNEDAIAVASNGRKKELWRNSASAKKITAFGEEKSIIGWSEDERCKIGYSGLKKRIQQEWNIEKAISTP